MSFATWIGRERERESVCVWRAFLAWGNKSITNPLNFRPCLFSDVLHETWILSWVQGDTQDRSAPFKFLSLLPIFRLDRGYIETFGCSYSSVRVLKAAGYCCKFLSAAVLDSMRTMTGGILWLLGLNTCNFDTVLLVDIPSQTPLTHFLSGGKKHWIDWIREWSVGAVFL